VRIVAFVDDLMDRSRLSAATPDVEFATEPSAATRADVVVVDLARHAAHVSAVRAAAPEARIVAFGPHVDGTLLSGARADGADVVLHRSQFFRDPRAALGHEI